MPTVPVNVLHLAAPLTLELSQGEGLPTKFSGDAYSGGLVPSYGVVIDLATTTVASRMPVLDAHDRGEVIGVIDAAEVNSAIAVRGQLFSDLADSAARKIAQRAKRGAPYQMSVGLFGYREVFVPAGQTMRVNSRDFTGPLTVLQGGKVREVSIVTLGADHDADARFFSQGRAASSEAAKLADLAAAIAKAQAAIVRLTAENQALLTRRAAAVPAPASATAKCVPAVSTAEIYARRRRQSLH